VKIREARFFRVGVFALTLVTALAAAPAHGARLTVSNTTPPCPGAKFTTIQSAINAAKAGDTITVCAGTYTEQLSITINLQIEAATGAALVPPAMQQNTTSLATGDGIAAAILVSGASNVTVSGLIVDGTNNGISACTPRLIGVYFQNSSGSLHNAAVRNFRLSAALNGCQSGTGVFVESGGGATSNVQVVDCSIHDYQKNGITANESGTNLTAQSNLVTGVGPTTGAAQNGIQIGFSAAGLIRQNTVTNNLWSPCSNAQTCETVATDVLVTGSNGVAVDGNTVGIAQVGIFIDGNNATVQNNKSFAASVFENITVVGNGNTVMDNDVFEGGDANIAVQGNNNTLLHNLITEAPIGIEVASGSTGNTFTGNDFFDVVQTIQDPAPNNINKRILADR
jgi:nitrous oxidase accessory protein NosD